MVDLDLVLQEFAELSASERASQWSQGDIAADAIRDFGKEVIGSLAEVGRCTKERVAQIARIAVAFPAEVRFPEVPWSLYRAAYNAAKRIEKKPAEYILEVLEQELSSADLAKVGRTEGAIARLKRRCEQCGARVSISVKGRHGQRIYCPVCPDSPPILGVLE